MSRVIHPPSGTFLRPSFPHLRPGPKMAPPMWVPIWVSGYSPAPWGTVMQPTCHMFLLHVVEHFYAHYFPTRGLGPRWHQPRGFRDGSPAIGPPPGDSDASNMSHVPHPPSATFLHPCFPHLRPGPKMVSPRTVPRWVSGYSPSPGGQLCNQHVMCSLSTNGTLLRPCLPHLRPGPKMARPQEGAEMGLGQKALPLGDSDATNMSHVPHPPSGTFLHPCFPHLRPRAIGFASRGTLVLNVDLGL